MTTESTALTCSCCGEPRSESELTGLACHPEIRICRGCVRWLTLTSGEGLTSTPILPTADMDESAAFYRAAGFEVDAYDSGYAFVLSAGREVLHLAGTDDLDPAVNQAACYVNTIQADEWHSAWTGAGLPVSAIDDQPHGMREFEVRDPSGNLLRIGRNI
jgi:catechol 2,3-dioxygenase-like lactoylglutathione lyase family enzyme